ncbi:ABC transporter ATP-binding protein [Laribacter hongkongensis]|uniref:ABC transporter ATP-binding protein n=1 Tax=Laribacter hongkongensis TaxID=168471 RepID=UPI00187847EB|nr:ATP-binding cassette domain-containing protein [Laribacter hongkongensis]MBE5528160.1 ABC transporter ATP-binding protein [Laribacter hongkongensis]
MTAVVEVERLRMGYGQRVLLDDASFSVQQGEIVALLGGSGSGKSSLMKLLTGLFRPLAGDIRLFGQSIVTATPAERAALQRRIGVMYQQGALFGSLTALQNVRFPLDRFTDLPREARDAIAMLQLDTVEMAAAAHRRPAELSGGMVKRVAIARALALGARLLFLDEPSAGLDPITSANLDETLLDLRERFGLTLVVVTHELDSIFRIADRALMLDAASHRLVADGAPAELRDHCPQPMVRQFFRRQPDHPGGLP